MHRGKMLGVVVEMIFVTTLISAYYAYSSNLQPRPSGPVADYAGVLDNTTKLRISALARSLWMDNKFGLIVATVQETGTVSADRYAADLYRLWGAGVKESPEDAILLLSINPPGAHIYVGAGARRYLSGPIIKRILANHGTPLFTAGDYNHGLLMLTQELAQSVRKAHSRQSMLEKFPLYNACHAGFRQFRNHPAQVIITFCSILTALLLSIIASSIYRRVHRFDYCGSAFGGGVDSGSFGGRIYR